jgi:predicted alpha/beta-hydrolase family hydrolase
MKTKKQKFLAHPSKDKVSSMLEIPAEANGMVVLGHGAGAGMHHANMQAIAEALHARGIATFRYQFPFMERGGGRDSKEVSLATVAAAVENASSLAPKLTLYAGGHSFGGRMTSLAAAESMLSTAAGLIFFAFPLHPSGKPSVDRATHLHDIKIPMLFLSGTRDKLFTVDLFKPIRKKLGKKAATHYLDTADHGYKILKRTRKSKQDVFEEMADVVAAWIDEKCEMRNEK